MLFSRAKLFRSRKVDYKNTGALKIDGRLYFGFLTNRVGLDPNARGVLRIHDNGTLSIDGLVRIARSCKVYVAGDLSVGDGTYINPGTMIFARTSITIGSGCAISWDCEIIDDDFHRLNAAENTAAPISIGDNVWVGSHCSILKGVSIGDGAVIGSRAVVTRDVPARALVVGSPAKIVRTDVSWG